MAEITAQLIKDLRERTGAGMSDCKKALVEVDGDVPKAEEFLRKKGLAAAAKKSGRVAAEGLVSSYIHSNNRIGVLVEVNCETDFVAANDAFKQFVKDIGMQIAAANPVVVDAEQLDPALIEKEREIKTAQAKEQGKKDDMIARIVDGQIAKWKKEVSLLDQIFVKDETGKKDIRTLVNELIGKLGENVKIRRFVRFELGEGIEKKKDDFVTEVARQAGL